MTIIEKVFEFIVTVMAYGAGAATFAYAIFLFLGRKWIENRFDERIASYEHKLTKDLEEFRHEIDFQYHGKTRTHDKEFEVLAQAWERMTKAVDLISSFASPVKELPNLDEMQKPELIAFLSTCPLNDFERQRVIEECHKIEYYKMKLLRYDFVFVSEEISQFRNYIARNGIFLSTELQEKFEQVSDIMRQALEERKTEESLQVNRLRERVGKKIRDDLHPIMPEIARLIQERLHFRDPR